MGDLREGFDRSVEANRELIDQLDDGLVEAGRMIADQIDYAAENLSGPDLTKALYLTPHLMNVLKEMLATPASRRDIKKPEAKGGKLGRLSSVPKPAAS